MNSFTRLLRHLARVLPLVAAGCSSPASDAPRWILDIEAPPPTRLTETGLFAATPARVPAADMLAYEPNHPLFSNGLDKERLLFVPPNETVTVAADGWTFPVGTTFSKTFIDDARPVETRLMFRRADGWDYALYVWNEEATDAEILPGNWPEQIVPLSSGIEHALPARLDCRVCHETTEESLGTPVLGVAQYQVSEALAAALPATSEPDRDVVTGRTPEETAALGYFIGNCVSCHTGGEGTNASFSLFPDTAVAATVDRETESETGEGIRVVPGNVAESVLYITVVEAREPDYEGVFKAMPPVGLTVNDNTVEPILRAWIEGL